MITPRERDIITTALENLEEEQEEINQLAERLKNISEENIEGAAIELITSFTEPNDAIVIANHGNYEGRAYTGNGLRLLGLLESSKDGIMETRQEE